MILAADDGAAQRALGGVVVEGNARVLDKARAEDSPLELVGRAVEICRRRRREWTFPHNFVEEDTPNWAWLVR